MFLVPPKRSPQKSEKVIDRFLGFNNSDAASESEFSAMTNLSNRSYPTLTQRPSRELVSTLVVPNSIFSFDGSLYTVDGNQFLKDFVSKGTVTSGKKCIIEFNRNILIFPDKKFYDVDADTFGSFASGTIVTEVNPDIDKATVHNNRVFGVKGNNIYASMQGNFKEWNVFEQLNNDSWATDVAGSVEFNTIGTYQNHVVMQSDHNMFELYGYLPSNFQVQETAKIGSNVFSYCELDSVLYFANREGVYSYAGGVPRKISKNINMPIESAELSCDKRYLYASVFDGTNHHLFVMDSATGLTCREDNLHVIQFALHQDKIHALCSDGKIFKFDSGNEDISWSFETIEYNTNPFSKKILNSIQIFAEMDVSSQLNVFIKGDTDTEYELVKSFFAEINKNLMIPVYISKNSYKIKIEGRGYVKFKTLKHVYVRGGD